MKPCPNQCAYPVCKARTKCVRTQQNATAVSHYSVLTLHSERAAAKNSCFWLQDILFESSLSVFLGARSSFALLTAVGDEWKPYQCKNCEITLESGPRSWRLDKSPLNISTVKSFTHISIKQLLTHLPGSEIDAPGAREGGIPC